MFLNIIYMSAIIVVTVSAVAGILIVLVDREADQNDKSN